VSTDWNIWCLDCKSEHRFCDANWREQDMFTFIRHAKAIGALAPLASEADLFELRWTYGNLDPHWFAKHADHQLVPRNEYGNFLEQCDAEFVCCPRSCVGRQHCRRLPGHEGDHSSEREPSAPVVRLDAPAVRLDAPAVRLDAPAVRLDAEGIDS
jgi:hypothetical protein